MFGCFAVYAVLYIQSCNDEAAGFCEKVAAKISVWVQAIYVRSVQ